MNANNLSDDLLERDRRYPARVVTDWRDATNTIVRFRPIAPCDAERIRAFVRALSQETRYLRFMTAMNELPPQMVRRFTTIDHRRDAALIAMVNHNGTERLIGVARYAKSSKGESCEFAVVVADDWRRRSLGRELLLRLIDTAKARGLKRIDGDVLAINRPMLRLANTLGFEIRTADDPLIRRVRLPLAGQDFSRNGEPPSRNGADTGRLFNSQGVCL